MICHYDIQEMESCMNGVSTNRITTKRILIAGGVIRINCSHCSYKSWIKLCFLWEKHNTIRNWSRNNHMKKCPKNISPLGCIWWSLSTRIFLQQGSLGTWDGKKLADIGITKIVGKNSTAQLLGIHRASVQQVLYEGLAKDVVRFDSPVEHIEQTKDNVVITLKDGTKESGYLLIGADGIHSTVRKHPFGKTTPRDSGYTCWSRDISSFWYKSSRIWRILGIWSTLWFYVTKRWTNVLVRVQKSTSKGKRKAEWRKETCGLVV